MEKRFVIELPEIAGTIKKAFNPSTCLRSFLGAFDISPLILTNAFANFEGFPVICAEPLSAEYSLYLEIALIIRKLIILALVGDLHQLSQGRCIPLTLP